MSPAARGVSWRFAARVTPREGRTSLGGPNSVRETMSPPSPGSRTRLAARLILAAAIALHVVGGWLRIPSIGTNHEELASAPSASRAVVSVSRADGTIQWEPHCSVLAPEGAESGAGPESRRFGLIRSEVRPKLSLCVAGMRLPVMVESNFSGFSGWPWALSWPLHHGEVWAMRRLNLALGGLALLLGYLLCSRLRDEQTAATVAIVTAGTSSFALPTTLLYHAEFTPWMLLVMAMLVLGPSPLRREPRRVVAAGALTGLAFVVNVKTAFLVAPLAGLVVARRRDWLRAIGARTLALAALAAAFASLPWWIYSLTDPTDGVANQVMWRLAALTRRASPEGLALEFLNQMRFAADIGAYAVGRPVHPVLGALAAAASAWAWYNLARWLVRRPADRIGVLAGAMTLVYLFVSLLLYQQQPGANYTPLYAVFGMVFGGAIAALSRRVCALLGTAAASRWLVLATVLAAGLAAGSAAATRAALSSLRSAQAPINTRAQAELREWLEGAPEGTTVVTTSYFWAGVPASLGRGRHLEVLTHGAFAPCYYASSVTAADSCLESAVDDVVRLVGTEAVFLLPAVGTRFDEPHAARLLPALERTLTERGLGLHREAVFGTSEGEPVLIAFRVGPTGA